MDVCQKALDRIEKIKNVERDLKDCKRYRVCPKCGEDMSINVNSLTRNGRITLSCEGCKFNLETA